MPAQRSCAGTTSIGRVNKVRRDELVPGGVHMSSIYEAIGGAGAVTAAVDLFYVKVLEDPALAPYFDGTDVDRLRSHQRAFLTAALGGPELYDGRSMADAHRGLAITDAAFGQVATHLSDTLSELGLDDDTVGAIVGKVAGLRDDVVEIRTPGG
jgi:hemoglobin